MQCDTFLYNSNQCCGSGMFIPDLGSSSLPIPDPGSGSATLILI